MDQVRNFFAVSPENPMFPVLLLLAAIMGSLSFFRPKLGLLAILVFILISSDVTVGRGEETARAVSIRIEDILLALVSGGWILNRAKTRTLSVVKYVPVYKYIVAMSFIIMLATIIGYFQETVTIKRGFFFAMKRLEYFWIFFMVLNMFETKEEGRRAMQIMLWFGAGVAVIGIIQSFLAPASALVEGGITATSGFNRSNTLGDTFLIYLGLVLGILIFAQSKRRIIFYRILLFMFLIAIILTKSRGAYVAVPPIIFICLYLSRKTRILYILLTLSALALAVYLTPYLFFGKEANILASKHIGDVSNQFESIGDVMLEGTAADSSLKARVTGWRSALPQIFRYPLFGQGCGSKKTRVARQSIHP